MCSKCTAQCRCSISPQCQLVRNVGCLIFQALPHCLWSSACVSGADSCLRCSFRYCTCRSGTCQSSVCFQTACHQGNEVRAGNLIGMEDDGTAVQILCDSSALVLAQSAGSVSALWSAPACCTTVPMDSVQVFVTAATGRTAHFMQNAVSLEVGEGSACSCKMTGTHLKIS
jgi:hypothetical protein